MAAIFLPDRIQAGTAFSFTPILSDLKTCLLTPPKEQVEYSTEKRKANDHDDPNQFVDILSEIICFHMLENY